MRLEKIMTQKIKCLRKRFNFYIVIITIITIISLIMRYLFKMISLEITMIIFDILFYSIITLIFFTILNFSYLIKNNKVEKKWRLLVYTLLPALPLYAVVVWFSSL